MSIQPTARSWVEVDLDALRRNFQTIQRLIGPGGRVIAMVKADAYGVGARRVVRALEPLEPWGYGVATAEEGIALREAGIRRPILVVTPLPADAVEAAAAAGLTPGISDRGQLERWAAAAERHPGGLDFHLEVDSGMGRSGVYWREVPEFLRFLREKTVGRLRWAGVFTHFHSADLADGSSLEQWARFQEAVRGIAPAGADLLVHAANSAAIVVHPEFHADAVRPGIFLYGGDPAPDLGDESVGGTPLPRPDIVVSVRSRIQMIRELPEGSTLGYGATYRAERNERWATLGIGYGDGLPRALSNRGHAIVRGVRVPIIGRISMDMTVIDVTEVPGLEAGEVASLIGRDGGEEITLEEVAGHLGTISYEILTGLTPRLPRVEVGEIEDIA